MSTALCYFSGTGNCLAVARELASLTGAAVVPVPEALKEPDRIESFDAVGIVFPVYLAPLSGVPLIIERFIRSIPEIASRRLFAVCTCGGYVIFNAVPALRSLARYVRSVGGRLSAEYPLRLPMNNLDYDHIPVPIERDSEVIISRSRAHVAEIARRIETRRRGERHALRALVNFVFAPMRYAMRGPVMRALRGYARVDGKAGRDLTYRELMPLTDRSIVVDESCVKCGTCVMVCPANNIRMTSDGPSYQGRCEVCFACDEWCPHGSIHHWSRARGVKYHHPSVKLTDMYSSRYQ